MWLRHFSVAHRYAQGVPKRQPPDEGYRPAPNPFHLKREATETIGDEGDDALTPLISSSPSSPPTESATVATIATVTLPPPILPSQPSQPEAKSFALARFQNRWYNEAAKKN